MYIEKEWQKKVWLTCMKQYKRGSDNYGIMDE